MSEVVELTRALVALPSVNPQDGDCLTEPYGESRIAQYIFDWFRRARLDVQLQQVMPGRANIIALAEKANCDQTLLVSGHMDTVDVNDMTIAPFDPRVRDGRIYGRGACDDKGPLAAMLLAFRDRVQAGALGCNLVFLATCGEEYNMAGSEYYFNQGIGKPSAAVFAEPTEMKVIVAHKGVVRLRLTCAGKSAHSSTPDLGQNAIYSMARVVTAVQEYARRLSRTTSHPSLPPETLSVTIIEGGRQINVIPDRCTAQIDWRILPNHDPQHCCEELSAFLRLLFDEPVNIELLGRHAPMEINCSDPVVTALLKSVQQAGFKPQTAVAPYATDASALVPWQIAAPIVGPGNPAQAHTQDEFITIDQLEKALLVYKHFLHHWTGYK